MTTQERLKQEITKLLVKIDRLERENFQKGLSVYDYKCMTAMFATLFIVTNACWLFLYSDLLI